MLQPVFMDTHLGQRVRSKRLSQGLSVRGLHKRSGVAVGTIRRIEAGEGEAYDHTLAKIAGALGITLDELMRGAA